MNAVAGLSRRSVRRLLVALLALAALAFVLVSSSATPAATPGLVAAYSFDEGSGSTVTDSSGNGNTGTISGATWTATGKYGGALVFNGTNARINVPNSASLQLSSGMTLEAWVNPSTVSSAWRDVMYKGNDNYYLEGTSGGGGGPAGGGTFAGANANAFASKKLTSNSWSFLATTYDGATLRLYVNGTLAASQATSGAITSSTSQLQIGGDSNYGQYFKGLIDQVRIYNTPLSATQLQADMTTPVGGGPTDTQPPSTPTGLAVSGVTQTGMTLSWNASSDNVGVTGYRLYLNGSQVGTALTTSYLFAGLSCGTSSTLGVAAVDAAGNLSGIATIGQQTAACPDTTPPSAPATLSASAANASEIDLSWAAASDNVAVTGYQVFRCQGSGCTSFLQVGTASGTTFNDTGLAAVTSYSYQVRAVDAAGNQGPFSNTASATTQTAPDTQAPSTPTGLAVSGVTQTGMTLSWNASSDNVGVTGYRLYLNGSQVGTSLTTSYLFAGLSCGTSSTLGVAAVDAAGNLSGIATIGQQTAACPDTTPPSAPATLSASAANASEIDLSWAAASDNVAVTGYQVFRCQGSGCTSFLQVGTASGTTFNDTGLAAVTSYSYQVRAVDAAGNQGPFSNTSSATTQAQPDTQPPSTPTGLAVSGVTQTGMTLSWNASSDNVGVTGYRLYLNGSQVGTSLTTSYLFAGLSCGTSSTLGVAAVDAAGNLSGIATVGQQTAACPDTTPPSAPATLSASAANASEIDLSWAAASDNVAVTGYQVFRCQGSGCTSFLQVGTASGTTFNDTGLAAVTSYSYQVRAVDAAGNQGPFSNTASATTQTAPDTQAPSTPTGLAVSGVTQTGMTLSWNASSDNVGVTGYRLYLNGSQVGTSLTTSYLFAGLSCGTSSTLGVAAVDAAGNLSGIATIGQQTAACPDTTPPSAPATLSASAANASEIDLSWAAASDNVAVTGYHIERCQGAGCSNFAEIATTAGTATSYSDTATVAATGYSYRVRANDAAGNLGPYSDTATATTTSSATYSIGGSVSGLSGTVVLQDNGGNDLSVNSTGPFTFSTLLANGAAYSVTVKTNPSGQTCTASNASGTVASANVTNIAVACTANSATSGADDFNRTDGSLGANWTAITDGGLSISSQAVLGSSSGLAGDIRTGETYTSDQYSQVEVTSTQLTGGQWIGPAVRTQNGGQNTYLGIYFWNSGSPELRLYKRSAGTWIQLGNSYSSGPLAAGTQLKLTAVGSTISFLQNGIARITVSDSSFTGGAPAIISYGAAKADNWAAGTATTPAPDTTPPSAPGTLTATAISSSRVDLSWAAASDNVAVTGYHIERCQGAGCSNFAEIATTAGTATSYSDTATVAATGYSYRVRANDAAGNLGPYSDTATATTTSSATYSIGGSVSGLSGTVVLQDNGGNDLSVNSTGPFTFSTLLANGAAYSVTVKTNPSGQTCTASNASGTVASANVTNIAVACTANSATSGADDFNRTDGSLGANWTAITDGGLSISSQAVLGSSSGLAGDIRTGETYTSDQYSQVEVTSTQLTGGQWIGPAVRTQNGGQNTYLGIYFWNSGSPELRLYKRSAGTWIQLGNSYSSGPLAAGTQLKLTAVGSTISFLQNGIARITVSDSSFTGGAPAIISYGAAKADNWAAGTATSSATYSIGGSVSGLSGTVVLQDNGGNDLSVNSTGPFTFSTLLANGAAYSVTVKTNPSGQTCTASNASGTVASANVTNIAVACTASTSGFQIQYRSTDANGVASYDVTSADDGYGTQVLRVLAPSNPAPGIAHNFLYVLPVEAGLSTTYGDGLETLRALDAQDQYNLTIIEPSFGIEPWFADNPTDANVQYETFMTKDLLPWVTQNLALTGHEQNWLIGFSKSGIGGEDLILKHPDLFTLAASWDFPADMSTYDQYGSSSASSYGTDANFQANYRLTPAFVDAHKAPFLSESRIWIGGYEAFQTDMSDYNSLLTSEGIAHTTETPQVMAHRWDSGWLPIALAALRQDSINVPATP